MDEEYLGAVDKIVYEESRGTSILREEKVVFGGTVELKFVFRDNGDCFGQE
jgi:hypothetical protein